MAKCVYLSKHHFSIDKMWINKKKALNVHSEPFDALLALKKIVIMKTQKTLHQSLPSASFCVIGMSFSDSIVAYAQNARNFEFIFILKAK
jgi:hypothetical protein